jgi:Uma2 family endonuclease
LLRHLSNYGISHNLGEAHSEVLFKLPLSKERNRKPDVAFVPYSQWPKDRRLPDTNAWEVLPTLCVEVVSPNDLADEIETKINEYFEAGVKLVWVIYPRHERVYAYQSPTQIHRLTRDDALEAADVFPGFSLRLAELFPQQELPSNT